MEELKKEIIELVDGIEDVAFLKHILIILTRMIQSLP